MPRPLAVVVACAAAALCAAVPGAASADDTPRKLRHLLRYVAADYRHAVRDGQVRSQAEYEEQLTLLTDARRLAAAVPGDAGPIAASIDGVRALVEQKAPERAVTSAVAAVESQIVGLYRLRDRPASAPDLLRGAALYLEHCATCHGPAGRADTARARSLSPPPPDLHDPALGEGMSPLRVFSTATFGVDGTSMVPFTFLSGEDRWDVAFFVTSLRHAGVPVAPAPAVSLPELTEASDGDLLDHLYAAGAAEADLAPMLATLRTAPLPSPDAPRSLALAAARAAWDEARLQALWRDPLLAREALLRGVHTGLVPARRDLALLAPDALFDAEQRAVLALAAVRGSAPATALPPATAALLLETTRADRTAKAAARQGLFPRVLTAAWGGLTGFGAGWLAFAAARARPTSPPLRRALAVAALALTLLWAVPLFLAPSVATGVSTPAGTSAAPGASAPTGHLLLLLWSLIAAVTAVLSAAASAAPRGRSAPRRSPTSQLGAQLVLACTAAVLAGQAIHTGQLAGVLPAHAIGPDLVFFPLANPTWEAICIQATFLAVAVARIVARARGATG